MAVCTFMGKAQRETANDYIGKFLMVPICQNVNQHWLKKNVVQVVAHS